VVGDSSRSPRDFTVEDCIADRKTRNRLGDGRQVLRQPVARQQANIASALEGEQSSFRSKIQSGPVKRSCVSVAAIGSIQSGKGSAIAGVIVARTAAD